MVVIVVVVLVVVNKGGVDPVVNGLVILEGVLVNVDINVTPLCSSFSSTTLSVRRRICNYTL